MARTDPQIIFPSFQPNQNQIIVPMEAKQSGLSYLLLQLIFISFNIIVDPLFIIVFIVFFSQLLLFSTSAYYQMDLQGLYIFPSFYHIFLRNHLHPES